MVVNHDPETRSHPVVPGKDPPDHIHSTWPPLQTDTQGRKTGCKYFPVQ